MANERKKRIQQRKEKEKEQRRNEIISKAMDLFISRGYDNTTMEEIALGASLSKGTLYNYFDSKDDLYLVVATIAMRRLNDYYEGLHKKPLFERFISLGHATYEFSKKFPELYKIASDIRSQPVFVNIYKKVMEGAPLNRNEAEMDIEVKRYQKLVYDPIKEAIDNKLIRNDLSPLLLATTITSLTGGIIDALRNLKPLYKSLGINADDIFDLVLEWVTEGIKPKD